MLNLNYLSYLNGWLRYTIYCLKISFNFCNIVVEENTKILFIYEIVFKKQKNFAARKASCSFFILIVDIIFRFF